MLQLGVILLYYLIIIIDVLPCKQYFTVVMLHLLGSLFNASQLVICFISMQTVVNCRNFLNKYISASASSFLIIIIFVCSLKCKHLYNLLNVNRKHSRSIKMRRLATILGTCFRCNEIIMKS